MTPEELLQLACEQSLAYRQTIDQRPVFPNQASLDQLQRLDGPLPDHSQTPESTLRLLDQVGSPATVASTGGRYFGFVTGGVLPVALAAKWLASTWDQNSALQATSPIVAKLESISASWILSLLNLPADAGVGFVSGATLANFTGLAVARLALLRRQGWEVNQHGLFGAPPIRVIVGDEVHASLLKALMLLGLGHQRVIRVPVDSQGRMRPEQLPPLDPHTMVCIQAGNVNSGAFDPALPIAHAVREAGAWLHVDGAFGLWAKAVPELAPLCQGLELADSWVLDAHKWLNTPYDCGVSIVRDAALMEEAMTLSASYLQMNPGRQPSHFVPEFSRRARAVEVWAALRTLGRQGVVDLVKQNCRQARGMASLLEKAGLNIGNDVVLNQVVVTMPSESRTRQVLDSIQQSGITWAGPTFWQGKHGIRVSVSSWATTDQDIQQSAAAIIDAVIKDSAANDPATAPPGGKS